MESCKGSRGFLQTGRMPNDDQFFRISALNLCLYTGVFQINLRLIGGKRSRQ